MRFERIKASDEVVELDWTTRAANGTEESTSMRGKGNPGPGLLNALAAFKDFVVNLLEIDESYEQGLKVTTIHLSEQKGGARGLVVTCRKDLDGHPSPFHFNTPLVIEALEDENEGRPGFFPNKLEDLITKAEKQADAWIRREREQVDMFESTKPAAAQDETRADNEAAAAVEKGAQKKRRRSGGKKLPVTEAAIAAGSLEPTGGE